MTKKFILILIMIFAASDLFCQSEFLLNEIIEAESVLYQDVMLMMDSAASSSKFLRMEKSGSIRWDVGVQEESWYDIIIRYRAFNGDKEEYLTINDIRIPVGFGFAPKWSEFSKTIKLNSGANSISITPSWGYIDIDWLKIVRAEPELSLKPVNNVYYKNYPRDLFFLLNNYDQKIQTVKAGYEELAFSTEKYPFKDGSVWLNISADTFADISPGVQDVSVETEDGFILKSKLTIQESPGNYDLKIITTYVEHGSSVLFILPEGKTMLVDCGKDWVRDSIIIPFLHSNNVNQLDYFFITHYHDDHDGGDSGKTIIKEFAVKSFFDYKSINTGDSLNLGGVDFKILNSFEDGTDENTSSLSFKLTYNGFIYQHGGDTYAVNEKQIMKRFPNDVKADVFYANHHFHGSVDPEYIEEMDPSIVLLQAQEAIYARSAYADKFKKEAEKFLLSNSPRYMESLPSLEVGTVIIRVNSLNDWIYETWQDKYQSIPKLYIQ